MRAGNSYEDVTAEILNRWTVTDLHEQSDDSLKRGDEMFYRASGDIHILDTGQVGLIKFWKVASNGTIYECRRFKNFAYCSCRDFFFRKQMCRHLAMTAGVYCENCRQLPAKVGKLCYDCDVTAHQFLGKGLPAKDAKGR